MEDYELVVYRGFYIECYYYRDEGHTSGENRIYACEEDYNEKKNCFAICSDNWCIKANAKVLIDRYLNGEIYVLSLYREVIDLSKPHKAPEGILKQARTIEGLGYEVVEHIIDSLYRVRYYDGTEKEICIDENEKVC